MPESLFAPRRFRRSYLLACFAGALIVEGSLVGIAQIYAGYKSWDLPPQITELDTGPVLGEQVQELILPNEAPEPTPEQPTPPPEETPPPDDTPPPDETPEMTMDTPRPTASPKPFKLAGGTPPPANAKHGDHPQNGVVGGVPHAEKTTGTPGAKALGTWTNPKPIYPFQARAAHLTGSGVVVVTTDASGHVSSANVTQSAGSAVLDNSIAGFARANWKGPPNSTKSFPFTFKLN